MRIHLFLSLLLISAFGAWAQDELPYVNRADSVYTIVDAINNTGGQFYVTQSEAMERLIIRNSHAAVHSEASKNRNEGYRVQVFSDNNVRSAKANAEYRKRSIEQSMPEYRAYLTYEAPYWRVRVGDFQTRVEAENAMRSIKNLFPSYAGDLRIIRDRINIYE